MTKSETSAVLTILLIAYPAFYKDKSEHELDAVVKFWHKMFADDDAQLVTAAVEAFIASDKKGFPPVIGVIKNKIADLMRPEYMTENEAWHLVAKAVSNGIYGAEQEFEKLPPVLQKLVGSPNQLRTWAMMDSESLHTVVSSNFMRSYKARAEYEREDLLMPGDVKKFISELSSRWALPVGADSISAQELNERRNNIRAEIERI